MPCHLAYAAQHLACEWGPGSLAARRGRSCIDLRGREHDRLYRGPLVFDCGRQPSVHGQSAGRLEFRLAMVRTGATYRGPDRRHGDDVRLSARYRGSGADARQENRSCLPRRRGCELEPHQRYAGGHALCGHGRRSQAWRGLHRRNERAIGQQQHRGGHPRHSLWWHLLRRSACQCHSRRATVHLDANRHRGHE